jgi:TonB family protein
MKRPASRSAWRALLALTGIAAIAVLVAQTLAAPRAGAAEDDQQKGIALIARAQLLETLLAPDTGPFRLHARIKVFGTAEGTREADYLLLAASPGQWSEQIRYPGHAELSGLSDGQRWRTRDAAGAPAPLHRIALMLKPAYHLDLPAEARITRLSQREVGGTRAFCFEASPTAELWQKERAGKSAISPVGIGEDTRVTLCFDADSGLLLSATYQGDLPRFEYEGQVALGTKIFPKVLRWYEGKSLVVEAAVQEVTREEPADATGFAPPAGAEVWPDCSNADAPRMVEKKQLDGGTLAYSRSRGQTGTMYALVEIGADGRVHDFSPLQGTPGRVAAALKETVQKWRYEPATCNGVPVPVTIHLAYTIPP